MPLHSYLPESLSRTPCAPVLQALFSYDGEHNAISKHFNGPGIRPIPATELALSEVFFSLRGTSGNYGSMQLAIRLQSRTCSASGVPFGIAAFSPSNCAWACICVGAMIPYSDSIAW